MIGVFINHLLFISFMENKRNCGGSKVMKSPGCYSNFLKGSTSLLFKAARHTPKTHGGVVPGHKIKLNRQNVQCRS